MTGLNFDPGKHSIEIPSISYPVINLNTINFGATNKNIACVEFVAINYVRLVAVTRLNGLANSSIQIQYVYKVMKRFYGKIKD